jgi:cell division protein FtsL
MAARAQAHAAVAEPLVRPRHRSKNSRAERAIRSRSRRQARRGVLWIVVSGILLVGVVFVNVAVLRLNLSLSSAERQRTQLRGENAALQAQLAAALASPRIEAEAQKQLGVRAVDPASVAYVDLSR